MTEAIKFVRDMPGHYTLTADGVARPVRIVRDGRNWAVQFTPFGSEHRKAVSDGQRGGFSNLMMARSYATLAWQAMRIARTVAHAEALKINREVVYVEGYGTRAYVIANISEDGVVSVRPLSGGVVWSFDRRAFGTEPF